MASEAPDLEDLCYSIYVYVFDSSAGTFLTSLYISVLLTYRKPSVLKGWIGSMSY